MILIMCTILIPVLMFLVNAYNKDRQVDVLADEIEWEVTHQRLTFDIDEFDVIGISMEEVNDIHT